MGQEEEDDEELAPAANNEAFRREYARNINSPRAKRMIKIIVSSNLFERVYVYVRVMYAWVSVRDGIVIRKCVCLS